MLSRYGSEHIYIDFLGIKMISLEQKTSFISTIIAFLMRKLRKPEFISRTTQLSANVDGMDIFFAPATMTHGKRFLLTTDTVVSTISKRENFSSLLCNDSDNVFSVYTTSGIDFNCEENTTTIDFIAKNGYLLNGGVFILKSKSSPDSVEPVLTSSLSAMKSHLYGIKFIFENTSYFLFTHTEGKLYCKGLEKIERKRFSLLKFIDKELDELWYEKDGELIPHK